MFEELCVRLATAVQALENERNQAVAELDEERERRAQEAMNLRKEVIAVQQSLTDDKERACGPHSPLRVCPCLYLCEMLYVAAMQRRRHVMRLGVPDRDIGMEYDSGREKVLTEYILACARHMHGLICCRGGQGGSDSGLNARLMMC